MRPRTPSRDAFTSGELHLIDALRTPLQVQRFLRRFPYNWETTLRTFRGVVSHGRAHCLEAVLFAATVLEQHGYPALALDLESEDGLDHVLFIYREDMYAPDADRPPAAEGTAELIIGKQRNGPVGTVRLAFLKQYTRFENLAPGFQS